MVVPLSPAGGGRDIAGGLAIRTGGPGRVLSRWNPGGHRLQNGSSDSGEYAAKNRPLPTLAGGVCAGDAGGFRIAGTGCALILRAFGPDDADRRRR